MAKAQQRQSKGVASTTPFHLDLEEFPPFFEEPNLAIATLGQPPNYLTPTYQAIETFGLKLLNHPVIVTLGNLLRVACKITKCLLCGSATLVKPLEAEGVSMLDNLSTLCIFDHEEVGLNAVAIDQNRPILVVQIGTGTLDDVYLDGGLCLNIITEDVRACLDLSKPQVAPYRLRMAHHALLDLVGLIQDVQITVHGIPYQIALTVIKTKAVKNA